MAQGFRNAIALIGLLQSGRLTAAELMDSTLNRIEAVNGEVNAIVALRERDALLQEAAAADAAGLTGPLAGLPMAIKDLAQAEGFPFTMGSPIFDGDVSAADDLFVSRLRAAGAIIIGKTNTPEFGLGSHTVNRVYGATQNPYDLTRSAGGSSGGAGAALATGMLALADGSDMMGSLRNPAAWNSVYGFRPSWGRVPAEPREDTFLHQLTSLGPMARHPQDLALLLDVMSGPDPRQPFAQPSDPIGSLPKGAVAGKRIGWLADWGGAYAMEPGILDLCQTALQVLEGLGAEIVPLEPPFAASDIWNSWTDLRSWAISSNLSPLRDRRSELSDRALWELERGLSMSAAQVHAASVIRSDWFATAAGLFDHYDALALPSAQVWPFPVDWAWPQEIAGRAMDSYHRWMEVVVPASLLGLPALSLPAGFGENGLPMGLQLIGRRGDDAGVLTLGMGYHEATDWPSRRPAMGG